MSKPSQTSTARTLIAFGAASQFTGLVFGTVVPALPYPRLGLAGHISWMTTGMFSITTGLILYQPNLVHISSPGLLQYIKWSFFSGVFVMTAESLNAVWGTKEFLSIIESAAQQANAPGGTPFQEAFMFWSHVVPSLLLISAFGVVAWNLLFGNGTGDGKVTGEGASVKTKGKGKL